jgi:glutamate synthase domain-containing protein 1
LCGIVGLFAKSEAIEANLGSHIADMLIQMTERGPDSAGVAVYRNSVGKDKTKMSLYHPDLEYDWNNLKNELDATFGGETELDVRVNHGLVVVNAAAAEVRDWLDANHPELSLMSDGDAIEIYKEKGLPEAFVDSFNLRNLTGTHGLGHTRMATESAVTTQGSHPFSTGLDLCLVHNGSLSNHNRLRRMLIRQGMKFRTENDSEVAAGYLTWRLSEGDTLEEAIESALEDLDGFYTFAIGTHDGFAVVRDPIACKPAVMAETDDWVAMASEFRAIECLPGANQAHIWEPEPAQIYSWGH